MHWFGTLLVFGGTILFSGERLNSNAIALRSFCYLFIFIYLTPADFTL
jgi:hypothetical protein